MSVEQYLTRYAEPEALLAEGLRRDYDRGIVVPALGETESLLDGLRAAARALPGRVLVVLVVNGAPGVAPVLFAQNTELLATLRVRAEPGSDDAAFLVTEPDFDLLAVDRSSPGRQLPARQGVGLARKIGSDVLLSAHRRGRLRSPWIFWTDADAALPAGHLDAPELPEVRSAAPCALLFPFQHVASEDADVTRATAIYEVCLRYHVLGLSRARSPYAFHSLGSALAISTEAYAAVRGAPKRRAGEDFYLLDKLAKLGPLYNVEGAPVCIRSRRSSRVPFGTGPRVDSLLFGAPPEVASPAAFRALGAVIAGLTRVHETRSIDALEGPLSELTAVERAAALRALDALDVRAGARVALRTSGADLARRLHTWFDALRTLQALHALRGGGLPDVAYGTALSELGFPADEPEPLLARLRAAEARLPRLRGPTLARSLPTDS